jgi:acyl-CoA carboxylase subunit alpha
VTRATAIRKLLVANRGEIALRVFSACRRLGIATVAVVARDDAGSLHARSADEVVGIESYLAAGEHVRAAVETRADAVHPGYGFLAENAEFAEAVEAAGLTFVGPPAHALRAGADKVAAREIAASAGVPVLPSGTPEEIGFPLLVKAAAGGGGRGMRIVREPGELNAALESARREAEAAFGDGTVYCERLLERPRHVEVQVLGDSQGTLVALGERDCSVQRRHQKLVEESPSPALDAELRSRMSDAALAFALAVGYANAGTVEFLVDGRDFFFLELNGRIQVEHPVTELVTGLDLVASQLEIAAGAPLAAVRRAPSGHAIEARIYAEDPRTFLPQAGRIDRLRLPPGVRVDAGVEEGDEIGRLYDPLLAKVIAHEATRAEALRRLAEALDRTEIHGVVTNLPFLRWLLRHPVFRAGKASIGFLAERPPLSPPPAGLPEPPWADDGWRLNLPPAAHQAPLVVEGLAAGGPAAGDPGDALVTAPMPGVVLRVLVERGQRVVTRQPLVILTAMKMETVVSAPYPAAVKRVHVSEGQSVSGREPLVELSSAEAGEAA